MIPVQTADSLVIDPIISEMMIIQPNVNFELFAQGFKYKVYRTSEQEVIKVYSPKYRGVSHEDIQADYQRAIETSYISSELLPKIISYGELPSLKYKYIVMEYLSGYQSLADIVVSYREYPNLSEFLKGLHLFNNSQILKQPQEGTIDLISRTNKVKADLEYSIAKFTKSDDSELFKISKKLLGIVSLIKPKFITFQPIRIHNDLSISNIMYNSEKQSYNLVDLESIEFGNKTLQDSIMSFDLLFPTVPQVCSDFDKQILLNNLVLSIKSKEEADCAKVTFVEKLIIRFKMLNSGQMSNREDILQKAKNALNLIEAL